jgi:hypothetical protein
MTQFSGILLVCVTLLSSTCRGEAEQAPVFPTEPAFLVPVAVRDVPDSRFSESGHKGLFAVGSIPKGTDLWIWTDRVEQIHHDDLETYIKNNFDNNRDVEIFLRQGFVLPDADHLFNSNPTDGQ